MTTTVHSKTAGQDSVEVNRASSEFASALSSNRLTPVSLAGTGNGHSEQVRSAVRAAAQAVTDFSWLAKGDAVFIKPVLNSGNPYPATTSPVAIATMIELLKEKGAGRVVVGDMSGIQHVRLKQKSLTGSSRAFMESSGMARAALEAGGEIYFFEEAGWDAFYEDFPLAGSGWNGGLMMPNVLREVEHIILMPRCARHVLAGATLGMKAAVGYWRSDTRLEYHRDAHTFHAKTAGGNTVETLLQKQRLVLTAADKILATFGPDDGRVIEPEMGLVIASQSVVAHDMVSLAWLLENRRARPASGVDAFMDNSTLLARVGNRAVVKFLSDWKTALTAQGFSKNGLSSIWGDRVLNHAYQIFSGKPTVKLEAANEFVPTELQQRLIEMTSPAA